jgi:hypothetical protein
MAEAALAVKPMAEQSVYKSTLGNMNVAVLKRNEVFYSPLVQGHYRKGYYIISRNAWFVSILGRVLVGEKAAAEAEDAMTKQVASVTNAIRKIETRVDKLCESLGVTDTTQYTQPKSAVVEVVHPVAYKHLETLRIIDSVLSKARALNVMGEMSSREMAGLELEFKKRLLALMTSTKGSYNSVLKASRKKNVELADKVDKAAAAFGDDGTLPAEHQATLQQVIIAAEDENTANVIKAMERPAPAENPEVKTEPSVSEQLAEERKAEQKAAKKASKKPAAQPA